MLPRIRNQRCCRDEIDDEQKCSDEARRRDAACQRHEDQRGPKPGKPARRSRYESDRRDGDGGVDADIGRDETNEAHPRSPPPVLFATWATIFAATASIS